MSIKQTIWLRLYIAENPDLVQYAQVALKTADMTPDQVMNLITSLQGRRLELRIPVMALALVTFNNQTPN